MITIPHYTIVIADTEGDLEAALDTGAYTEHKRVGILHADQVTAEQMGARLGLGSDLRAAPMSYTTLWAWCALRRRGVDVPEFPLFKQRVIALEQDDDDDAPDGEPLDPTVPDPGSG